MQDVPQVCSFARDQNKQRCSVNISRSRSSVRACARAIVCVQNAWKRPRFHRSTIEETILRRNESNYSRRVIIRIERNAVPSQLRGIEIRKRGSEYIVCVKMRGADGLLIIFLRNIKFPSVMRVESASRA